MNIKNIYQSSFTKTSDYLDVYRYINWFNQERGQMFFSRGILLVEGLTEKGLLEFLSDTKEEWYFLQRDHIYILDCLGKHDIIRWAEIIKALNIPLGIIYDLDNNKVTDKVDHLTINNKIKELYSTNIITEFEKDFETYLTVKKSERNHEHQLLLYVDDNVILKQLPSDIADDIRDKKDSMAEQLVNLSELIEKHFNF